MAPFSKTFGTAHRKNFGPGPTCTSVPQSGWELMDGKKLVPKGGAPISEVDFSCLFGKITGSSTWLQPQPMSGGLRPGGPIAMGEMARKKRGGNETKFLFVARVNLK